MKLCNGENEETGQVMMGDRLLMFDVSLGHSTSAMVAVRDPIGRRVQLQRETVARVVTFPSSPIFLILGI